jgi:hypothetical protein
MAFGRIFSDLFTTIFTKRKADDNQRELHRLNKKDVLIFFEQQ